MIPCEGQQLSAFLHTPSSADAKQPAVAIFHGLMGSKHQPHRMFVELADGLAEAGFVALRVDFRGRGDSDGASIDATPQADLVDARCAVDYLAAQPNVDASRIALVGMSWGGLIAALLNGSDPRTAATALWSSAPSERLNWSPDLRDFDGRLAAELWGNLIGAPFYEGLKQLNPLGDLLKGQGPVLMVYGSEDEITPAAQVETARAALARASRVCDVVALDGAEHNFFAVTAKQAAIAQTVRWLEKQMK
jgi:dienelactone hydrolase